MLGFIKMKNFYLLNGIIKNMNGEGINWEKIFEYIVFNNGFVC